MIDFEEDIIGNGQNDDITVNTNSQDFLWVNKYRPKTLERFCLDEKPKKKFAEQIANNNIQNMCLVGGPGIGKTTLALILANSIKDSDSLFVSCASGEGKIDTIASKIIPFCQAASKGQKVIILDELDSASASQANSFQKALRNVIEAYPDCRFIATANIQSNIFGPILSRLIPEALTFSVGDMVNNLIYILGEEKIEIVSESTKVKKFLGTLIKAYYPDMRLVIGKLQSACIGGKLDVDEVVIDNKELIRATLSDFMTIINTTQTALELRKSYNNEVLSFGNNGGLAKLCSPYGLALEIFNHIIECYNPTYDDLMSLSEYLFKIEHTIDQETQLFGFLLKVKSMNLR